MKLNPVTPLTAIEHAHRLGLSSERFQYPTMSQSAQDQISYTKRKDRPQLRRTQWNRSEFYLSDATKQLFNCPDQIDRVNADELSVQQFIEKYEKPNLPVIIRGLTKEWKTEKHWTFDAFYERFKDVKFKVGEDEDGHKIRIRLKYFMEYVVHNTDDSPLYMFESSLETSSETRPIIDNYKVPKYFKDDLFSLAGERRRPPYRWLLIGPERSGTTVHIDPLNTSAWNASFCGHKRWVLFKQSVPKGIVKGYKYMQEKKSDQSIHYFTQILPRILQNEPPDLLGTIEFIQYPGQTVFVPGGWWHAVINLDDSFAVTQNVMTHVNFEKVWVSLRRERRKFAEYFLRRLKKKEPGLYERAVGLNRRDGWVMGSRRQRKASMSYEPPESSSSSSSSSEYDTDSGDETHSRSRSRNKKHNRDNGRKK